jgi:hypothetical protein
MHGLEHPPGGPLPEVSPQLVATIDDITDRDVGTP